MMDLDIEFGPGAWVNKTQELCQGLIEVQDTSGGIRQVEGLIEAWVKGMAEGPDAGGFTTTYLTGYQAYAPLFYQVI